MGKLLWTSFLCLLFFFTPNAKIHAADNQQKQLAEYMKTQSLVWNQLPLQWNEGAFLGNGKIGMMVYVDTIDNSLTLWLSRPDVTDHRLAPNRKTSLGVEGASVMTDYCRLDVGKMKMFPQAKIVKGTMQLDIYNGELTGELITAAGVVSFTALTPYNSEANIVKINSDIPCHWRLEPPDPYSSRLKVFPDKREELHYINNPEPVVLYNENGGQCVNKLLAGGDFATYWDIRNEDNSSILYLSIKNDVPMENLSLMNAKNEVAKVQAKGYKKLRKENRKWWNNYYSTGLINLPDKQLENFYHIQLYKLATCSHPDGPAMDNFGTFYKKSQWPGMWWNLNVQLTYMSTLPTNRLQQASNFIKLMDESFLDIMTMAPSTKIGDYSWALFIYYSFMKYSGYSPEEINARFMSKARAVFGRYAGHLEERNGVVNLLNTESPEYEGFKTYDNSNYNLASLRWLLQTMIEVDKHDDSQCAEYQDWQRILDKLHPEPVDENGYMIGSNQSLKKSHRHYSHLLSFYPLRLHNPLDSSVVNILEKSIDHWLSIGKGKGLAGYSYTGSASLYAFLGKGEKAYRQLNHFLNNKIGFSLLLPNTMYVECDGKNPVIETPLSAATAVTEMLIQENGDKIRIFPAIPVDWKDCCFNSLRTENAFVVSACRENGKTKWIEITNDGHQQCQLYLPEWKSVKQLKGKKVKMSPTGDGCFVIDIPHGKTIVLCDGDHPIMPSMAFLPKISENGTNFYGVKDTNLPSLMEW